MRESGVSGGVGLLAAAVGAAGTAVAAAGAAGAGAAAAGGVAAGGAGSAGAGGGELAHATPNHARPSARGRFMPDERSRGASACQLGAGVVICCAPAW